MAIFKICLRSCHALLLILQWLLSYINYDNSNNEDSSALSALHTLGPGPSAPHSPWLLPLDGIPSWDLHKQVSICLATGSNSRHKRCLLWPRHLKQYSTLSCSIPSSILLLLKVLILAWNHHYFFYVLVLRLGGRKTQGENCSDWQRVGEERAPSPIGSLSNDLWQLRAWAKPGAWNSFQVFHVGNRDSAA